MDCEDSAPISDANHADRAMLDIIANRDAIAALAPVGAEVKILGYWISPEWFAKHAGHRLIPRDEYGRCLDECGKDMRCGACPATYRCRLPEKHDGDCKRERPKP